jgi:hypothetical protein
MLLKEKKDITVNPTNQQRRRRHNQAHQLSASAIVIAVAVAVAAVTSHRSIAAAVVKP